MNSIHAAEKVFEEGNVITCVNKPEKKKKKKKKGTKNTLLPCVNAQRFKRTKHRF